MHGLGTIVNVAAIVVGGLAGLLGGRRIPERLQKTLMSAMGVSVLFVGVSGALFADAARGRRGTDGAGDHDDDPLAGRRRGSGRAARSRGPDGALRRLAQGQDESESDGGFIGAFVTASLTVCIGAMAIVGSIQDGILGDHATLFAKGRAGPL